MSVADPFRLVHLVRDIAHQEVAPVERAVGVGVVAAVEAGKATITIGANEQPTPGFIVPPHLAPQAGDLVEFYRLGAYMRVNAVLNRNAVIAEAEGVLINAKDHGVKGDGTDDTAAINALILTVSSMSRLKDPQAGNDEYVQGGTIIFPTGLYSVTQIVMQSYVKLVGVGNTHGRSAIDKGAYMTRFKQRDGSNGPMFFVGKDVLGIGFEDISLDGNKANNLTGNHHGIQFEDVAPADWAASAHVKWTKVEHVLIRNFRLNGIDIGAPHLTVGVRWCQFLSCDQDGIRVGATDCFVDHCSIGDMGRYGVNVELGANHVTDTDIWNAGSAAVNVAQGPGGFAAPSDVIVSGGVIGPNHQRAVSIGAGVLNTKWIGCSFRQSSKSSLGTYPHITVASASPTHSFTACSFSDGAAGGPFTKWDYEITGGAQVFETGCTHTGQWTAAKTNQPTLLWGAEDEAGSAFPASPQLSHRFYRFDRNIEYFWDGTRWLSTQLFHSFVALGTLAATNVTHTGIARPETDDKWLEQVEVDFFVVAGGTALDVNNKWVHTLYKRGTGGGPTQIATYAIDSGASGTHRRATVAVNALMGTTFGWFQSNWVKTGTPGNLNQVVGITYRLVG